MNFRVYNFFRNIFFLKNCVWIDKGQKDEGLVAVREAKAIEASIRKYGE